MPGHAQRPAAPGPWIPADCMRALYGERGTARLALDAVAAGDFVRLCAVGERLWVAVRAAGATLEGYVLTCPILTVHGLQQGSRVSFTRRDVLEVVRGSQCWPLIELWDATYRPAEIE